MRLSLTRQGFFRADRVLTQEAWRGAEYDGDQWRIWGNMQVFRWLRPSFFISRGSSLYYDEVDPFVGPHRRSRGGGLIQIGGRFSEDIEYSHNTFDRPDTGARVYTVNLLNTRTTYQFTKELAIRCDRALRQPGGQGADRLPRVLRPASWHGRLCRVRLAVSEARVSRQEWIDGEGEYLTTQQGLFLKASYLSLLIRTAALRA